MSGDSEVFQFTTQDDILIVMPVRDFMSLRDSDLRDAYNDTYRLLMDGSIRHLIFDFEQMKYFGSTFVGIMIRLARKTRQSGGEALLCNMSDEMKAMLKQLMLLENTTTDFFWRNTESRDDAINWLQQQNA